jgi:hypothetical protein
MKNGIIKKKMQNKNNLEPDSQSQSVELLILFWPLLFLLFHLSSMNNNVESQQLAPILEDNGDFLEDHYGGVVFDLLE